MSAERHSAVKQAFAEAVALPPDEWDAWLAEHVEDEAVRREVAELLEHHRLIDAPAAPDDPAGGAREATASRRLPIVLVVAALLAVWWAAAALSDLQHDVRDEAGSELVATRDAVHRHVRDWSLVRHELVGVESRRGVVQRAVADLRAIEVASGDDVASRLLASDAQAALRIALADTLETTVASGALVLSVDGRWIAASAQGEHRIGALPTCAHLVLEGTSGWLAPDDLGHVLQRDIPVLGVNAPVVVDGRVEAQLVFLYDIGDAFDVDTIDGAQDAYLFDREGRFLTRPRRTDALVADGLTACVDDASCQVWAMPAVGLPQAGPTETLRHEPTQLIARALADDSRRVALDAYRSYHGADVVGATSMLVDEGIGVAVEGAPPSTLGAHASRIAAVLTIAVGVVALLFLLRVRPRLGLEKTLGPYRLEALVSAGELADVYRARHMHLGRSTAVKVLRGDALSPRSGARFRREVRLASQLRHPNTVEIYDFGRTSDGVSYCAMEYLDGATLEEVVRGTGPLDPARVVHVLRGVCASLEEAHAIGLLHRDIKPANVMLCRSGGRHDVVKVLDFALLEQSGAVVHGTPPYIAPERLGGSRDDERSDVFSVGALAFLLLTGRPLHEGGFDDVLRATLDGSVRAPSEVASVRIPPELDALVRRCVSREPLDRPWSVRELRERLEALPIPTWTPDDAATWWHVNDGVVAEVSPRRRPVAA